jgi:hypothetical protein
MRNRFTFALIVLIVVFVGLGFYLNWFEFSAGRNTQDDKKVTLKLDVDTAKIKEDTATAKDKAKEMGDKLKSNVDTSLATETAKGSIVRVEEADRRITLMSDTNKELTIQMESSSKVRVKDADVQLKDLKVGDRVTVVYKSKEGRNIAQTVTVERAS